MQYYFVLILLCSFSFLQAQNNLEQLSYKELDSLTMLAYSQGDYAAAVPYMQQGIKKSKAEFGEMDSLHSVYIVNLAFFYDVLGKAKKAEQLYLQTITIREKIFGKTHPLYADALKSLAGLYSDYGRYAESEQTYLKAQQASAKAYGLENSKHASLLNDFATLYYKIDKYEEAETLFLQSNAIRKKAWGKMHPNYAISINNLASLYGKMGKDEEAILLLTESKAILEQSGQQEHAAYANILNNLGDLYKTKGNLDKAKTLMETSAQLIKNKSGTQNHNYSIAISNLAVIHRRQKAYKEAEKLYFESLAILEKLYGKQHPAYATSLKTLAITYSDMKDYERAEKGFEEAIAILHKSLGNQHPGVAAAFLEASKVSLQQKHLEIAFARCMSSIASNSKNFDAVFPNTFANNSDATIPKYAPQFYQVIDNPKVFLQLKELDYLRTHTFLNSLAALARIAKAQFLASKEEGNQKIANQKLQQYYIISKAALDLNEKMRNQFTSNADKLSILRKNSYFVDFGIDAARHLQDDNYAKEAFAFAEQNKSILLADALKSNQARHLGDLPDSLIQKENTLIQQKDKVKKQKAQAKSPEQKAQLIAKENELNLQVDAFLKSLKGKYPKYHAIKYKNITAQANEIQALLDDKSLFLEYFVSDSTTYLFALTAKSIQLYPISVHKKQLTDQIKKLRQALSNYRGLTANPKKSYNQYTQAAYWFYNNLLAVALNNTSIENLIIITDGELGHLPFEAFLTEPSSQEHKNYKQLPYLVHNYNISYDYSATLWKENRNAPARNNNHQILACAASYTDVHDTSLYDFRLPHVVQLRNSLAPIPETRREVQTLSKRFKGLFLTDTAANEAFFKANVAQYGVIHLAMHGLLHPRLAMLSSLAFTENKDSLEDNFLQAFEISRLHLNADLVVLSACETGYGQFEQGEGVVSLARSFMYAGTPSLIVSLWQVNDQSTSVIMQDFYEGLSNGLSKSTALRQAKLNYLDRATGLVAHPAFWSPFIQLGDDSPIQLTTKPNLKQLAWYGIIGLIVTSLLFLFLKRRKQEV